MAYNDPRYEDSRYQDPHYQDSRYQDPHYQDPRYQDPRYQDSRYQDPSYNDSPYGGDSRYHQDPGYSSQHQHNDPYDQVGFNDGPYNTAPQQPHVYEKAPAVAQAAPDNPRYESTRYEGAGDPTIDEFGIARAQPETRHAPSAVPWWNPRYWTRKIWAIVVAIVVVILVVVIAVAVTQSKKNNSYPDYSTVSYKLSDKYEGESFFEQFNYITGYDKTHGFVHYVPEPEAKQRNLTYATADAAVLKVDTDVQPDDNPNASTGRFSVRVESKRQYNGGLFIFDVRHTPYGCATWPALWLTDDYNWPKHGEIDIMEATNKADDGNQIALHTTPDCSMKVKRKQSGDAMKTNCDAKKDNNAGCGVKGAKDSYGAALNDKGGGIMALEWRDAGIRMWQFARNSIPKDITGQKPDPSTWGTALADYPSTDCDIGSHFKNNSIVVNIDLCGDLGMATYKDSGCPSNCTDFAANNPDAFKTAFWEFGSFQVYQPS